MTEGAPPTVAAAIRDRASLMAAQGGANPPRFTERQLEWLEETFGGPPAFSIDQVSGPDFRILFAFFLGAAKVPEIVRSIQRNTLEQERREAKQE